jgi:hypothetical protein
MYSSWWEAVKRCTYRCRAKVPLELLVNVDDPQDAAVWLDWAYNRSRHGLDVVPVFSNNIHEHRCGSLGQGRTIPPLASGHCRRHTSCAGGHGTPGHMSAAASCT